MRVLSKLYSTPAGHSHRFALNLPWRQPLAPSLFQADVTPTGCLGGTFPAHGFPAPPTQSSGLNPFADFLLWNDKFAILRNSWIPALAESEAHRELQRRPAY